MIDDKDKLTTGKVQNETRPLIIIKGVTIYQSPVPKPSPPATAMVVFLQKTKGFFSRSLLLRKALFCSTQDQVDNIRVRFYSDGSRVIKGEFLNLLKLFNSVFGQCILIEWVLKFSSQKTAHMLFIRVWFDRENYDMIPIRKGWPKN